MDLVVAVLILAVNLPLAGLLAWRAAQRRVPVFAASATIVLLLASCSAVWDPAAQGPPARAAIAVANISLAVLLAVYPDGRFTPRWIAVPAFVEVGLQAGNVATGFALEQLAWWPWHFLFTWTPLLLGGQLYRYVRRSSVAERERARWPLLALVAMVFGFLLWTIAVAAGAASEDADWLANLLLDLPAPAFAVGLLAPRLLAVDRLLRVVLGAGTWAVAVGLVAWALSLGADAWAPRGAAWLTGVATAVVAVPLAVGARRMADAVVSGRHPDALRSLVALGDRLSATVDPRGVAAEIVEGVTGALGLRYAGVQGKNGVAAESGEIGDAELSQFPITYAGEELGELAVAPRPGEAQLTPSDRVVLAQICAQAAPALNSARVVAELEEARSRIVFAREEERKRLRRDLHDELAPTFAGLGLSAAAVEAFARVGDDRAADAAEHLVTGLHAATRQLREVAYDLRPPVLDDRGLAAAIRERVAAPGSLPVVEVEAPQRRLVLPAAVESAALRIAQEAVANVRRHAAASRCTVTLGLEPGMLRLDVVDDGRGLPTRVSAGVGLRSMHERAAEVRGNVEVTPRAEGGTRVTARLPAPGPSPAQAQATSATTPTTTGAAG